jgi:hypothetical protein
MSEPTGLPMAPQPGDTTPTAQQIANVTMLGAARDKMVDVDEKLSQSTARWNDYNGVEIDLTLAAARGMQDKVLQLKYQTKALAEEDYERALSDQRNQCRNIVYQLTHLGSCKLPFPADPAPPQA